MIKLPITPIENYKLQTPMIENYNQNRQRDNFITPILKKYDFFDEFCVN